MTKLELKALKRTVFSRKTKSLRSQGIIPANVYGKNLKSLAVQIDLKDFTKVFQKSGETNLIYLNVDQEKKPRPVLATNLQKNPVTESLLHLDFHQVDLTEKVTVAIPTALEGESPAVKEKGAVLITLLDEIKVEALPQDLPDKFIINVDNLREFNDSILIKDLQVDRNKLKILAEEDEAIVMVQEPSQEEIAPPEAPPAVVTEEEKVEETAQAQEKEVKKEEEPKEPKEGKEKKT